MKRRQDDLVVREVGADVLVLDLRSEHIHQLNQTASFVWHNCEGASSPAAIAELLAFQFDVGQDIAIQDVQRTLEMLHELKLIVGDETASDQV
ncbi:MAG: PqqD family protein [Betaproteobacteria bacterium]